MVAVIPAEMLLVLLLALDTAAVAAARRQQALPDGRRLSRREAPQRP